MTPQMYVITYNKPMKAGYSVIMAHHEPLGVILGEQRFA